MVYALTVQAHLHQDENFSSAQYISRDPETSVHSVHINLQADLSNMIFLCIFCEVLVFVYLYAMWLLSQAQVPPLDCGLCESW